MRGSSGHAGGASANKPAPPTPPLACLPLQLLGAMAHCAPKQLSTCLPTIVPRLGEVLSDPHPKVGQAARQALDEVGDD